jgi:hypothetical protein
MVPTETTIAVVEYELRGAEAWAARHGWKLTFSATLLSLTAEMLHPIDGSRLRLRANVVGYRAVAPAWEFVDPDSDASRRSDFPAPGAVDGKSSIFHSQPVICAPFNRLAYAEGNGPHKGDWGSATGWLNVSGDIVRATTLGEMLAVIELHLSCSPGRLS